MIGKKRIWKLCAVLSVMTAIVILPSAVFAVGDGTGGGGGAVIPLYMDWSYPADGASGVSVTPVIQCKFSHNVAQANVVDRNKTLITLEKADGANVDITVFMADAQIQFDKRQFIYVSPVRPLNYGTKYILTIHEGIQAKNNMATDEVQTVAFTTEYARSSFNAPIVAPPVSTELSSGSDTSGAVSDSAGVSQEGDMNAVGSVGSAEADFSGEREKNDSDVGGGNSAHNDADGADGSDDGSAAGYTDENSGNHGGGSIDQTGDGNSGAVPDDSSGDAVSTSGESVMSAAGKMALIISALCLTAAIGAAAAGRWSGRRGKMETVFDHHSAAAKHLNAVLAATLLLSGLYFGAADSSYASVPKEFTVRVKIGDTIVSEKTYSDTELRGMKQIRQTYSGIDEDGLPCIVGAEGVALTDLVQAQGVDIKEVESISIYGSGNWLRNMAYDYLYGVSRSFYPHLCEAYRIKNGMSGDRNGGVEKDPSGSDSESGPEDGSVNNGNDETNEADEINGVNSDSGGKNDSSVGISAASAGNAGGVGKPSVDPDIYKSQDGVSVVPMLALRSNTQVLEDEISWSSLSAIEGYRFCFGQMNPSDGAYLMYGYNLQAIDIKVSAAGEYAKEKGMQDLTGKKVKTPGGADSVGSADVAGPYTNPFTGETVDQLPDELEIQIGYFGTDYYTIKRFTFDDIAAMPQMRQAYSVVSKDGTNGILTAMGVRLVDVITAAGVDVSSVSKIGFFRGNQEGASGISASKSWLLDMNRYYYPNLTAAFHYTTGGKGAARSAVRTDTLIALKDYWDEMSSVPDFFRLNGTHRYHLVYGQTSAKSDNLEKSIMWISTIKIQLEGAPSSDDWLEEYLGKVIGSGEGDGTGNGNGSGSAVYGGTKDSAKAAAAQTEETDIGAQGGILEKIDAREKHVYELSGGSVSWNLGSERKDYRMYIAAVFGASLLFGACVNYICYRRRVKV